MDISKFAAIPYLDHERLAGGFLHCLTFFDDGWRMWVIAGEEHDELFEMKGWPAEAGYFSRTAESPGDICLHLLNLIAQHANTSEMQPPLNAIVDDVHNLSASLAKLRHFQTAEGIVEHGRYRMAITEVEYIVLLCRAMFDSLQEIMKKAWDRVTLLDQSVSMKELKGSFGKMIEHAGNLQSAEQISKKFGLPPQLSDCYESAQGIFVSLRRFRDNIVHHGSTVQHIFVDEGKFLIAQHFAPFPNLLIWSDDEKSENGLVPLLPAVEMLIYKTITSCDEFSKALQNCVGYPKPVVPGMYFFLRGYFTNFLLEALVSSSARANLDNSKPTSF